MTKTSRLSFADTVAALSKTIVEAGNTLFATIDQRAAAKTAGLTIRPTTLMIFGNPKGGTPLMQAFPLVALELPLKLLIWEEDLTVNVSFVPMSETAARYAITGFEVQISAMDRAIDALTDCVI